MTQNETGFSKKVVPSTITTSGGTGTVTVQTGRTTEPQSGAQSQLEDIYERLSHQNDRQVELLKRLEEKLHKILNKQTPEKESVEGRGKPNDAIHAFEEQYLRLVNQNDWLEKLVFHISEII